VSDLFGGQSSEVRRGAVISDCGGYRYALSRYWEPGPVLAFVMLNPSTADATLDDPTIRRCMGFARREALAGIMVANLFALRSTDPSVLKCHAFAFGAGNSDALTNVALDAAESHLPVVCAWGAGGTINDGDKTAMDILRRAGARLVCLGKTKDGYPRHPLYVRADQPLVSFP
jgi:hypothetical protein